MATVAVVAHCCHWPAILHHAEHSPNDMVIMPQWVIMMIVSASMHCIWRSAFACCILAKKSLAKVLHTAGPCDDLMNLKIGRASAGESSSENIFQG
jgi:hypothetical protein